MSCSSLIGIFLGIYFIDSLGVRALYMFSGLVQLSIAILGFMYLFTIFNTKLLQKSSSVEAVIAD
jgi:hypothetical protein